jgi:site-specific DNA-adenine methylase
MFTYQGSKRKELPFIRDHEPKEFKTMVDVFGGGGNVFLDYLQRYPEKTCIYNDFDDCLYEIFYTVAIGNAADLEERVVEMFNPDTVRADRINLLKQINAGEVKNDAVNFLYLSRTSGRGFWNVPYMIMMRNGNPCLSPSNLSKYAEIVNDPDCIHNNDYKNEMNLYKHNSDAFLYLDPPYNGKNTSCQTYKNMVKGEYHNFLIFIEQFMKDPETKCKVMLNIDFQGEVYARFKDLIKLVYPVRYNSNSKVTVSSKSQQYHCIVCNY